MTFFAASGRTGWVSACGMTDGILLGSIARAFPTIGACDIARCFQCGVGGGFDAHSAVSARRAGARGVAETTTEDYSSFFVLLQPWRAEFGDCSYRAWCM